MSEIPKFVCHGEQTDQGRELWYAVAGFWSEDKVRVSQRVNPLTGLYRPPEVSHSVGGQERGADHLDAMENFAAALQDALRTARQWDRQTGEKPGPKS